MPGLRLFVGVGVPGVYQDELGRLARVWQEKLRSRTSWTRPGNWHLTLKFLGDVNETRVAAVRRGLETVAFAPFMAQAKGAGIFPDKGPPRVIWVGLGQGAPELATLAGQVDEALGPLGLAREARPFQPHLTLCRVKHARGDPWREVIGEIARSSWPGFSVESFTLWRSVLGPDGPNYSVLARFGATSM